MLGNARTCSHPLSREDFQLCAQAEILCLQVKVKHTSEKFSLPLSICGMKAAPLQVEPDSSAASDCVSSAAQPPLTDVRAAE